MSTTCMGAVADWCVAILVSSRLGNPDFLPYPHIAPLRHCADLLVVGMDAFTLFTGVLFLVCVGWTTILVYSTWFRTHGGTDHENLSVFDSELYQGTKKFALGLETPLILTETKNLLKLGLKVFGTWSTQRSHAIFRHRSKSLSWIRVSTTDI
jgi:hypothetical protein